VRRRRLDKEVAKDFGLFERELHVQVMEVEREILGEEMARGARRAWERGPRGGR